MNNKKTILVSALFMLFGIIATAFYAYHVTVFENAIKNDAEEVISEPQENMVNENTDKDADILSKNSVQNNPIQKENKTKNVLKNQSIQKESSDNEEQNIKVDDLESLGGSGIDVLDEKAKPKKKNLFSYDIKKFADEPELIEALNLLENYGDEEVLKNIKRYGFRVKFDDFLIIVYKRDSYFGMSAFNQYGTRVILVNSLYKSAPPEQLACIIAHESMHVKTKSDIDEEVVATLKEAECWNNLREKSKIYPDTKLTERLNKITKSDSYKLREQIANTYVYREQFN